MKKIILFTVCVFFGISAIQAQNQFQHEVSVNAGGGLSSLLYSPEFGSQSNSFGGKFGAGYTFFFAPQWGVTTGIETAFYNSSFEGNCNVSYEIPNNTGIPGKMFFNADFKNYEETQQALLLQIPLMLQFQTTGKHKFYAALGGRIGLPISASYESKGSVYARGYSEYTANYYDENDNPLLFGNFDVNTSEDLDLNVAIMGALEAGMKWNLGNQWNLYTGIYFDYAFNNVRKNDADKELIVYNANGNHQFNSMVQSKYNNKQIIEKINPIAFGFKASLSFGFGKQLKDPRIAEEKVK